MRSPLLGLTSVNGTMTSKTSSLKALLLRAWRERWSDLQWGIHIKTILPRGVCGDVYNLADCILQQALIGPGPNQLLLSYLKHTLSSQLVSYAAVLMRIKKYQDFDKAHCVISLLEFLQSVQGITCRGKPEEAVLAKAVLSVTLWLLQCINHALETHTPRPSARPQPAGGSPLAYPEMLQLPANILAEFVADDFIMAILYLAKHEDDELHQEVVKRCKIIENLLHQQRDIEVPSNLNSTLGKLLLPISHGKISSNFTNGDNSEPLTYCLQPLLVIELQLHPCLDTQVYVNRLRVVQRLKGFSTPRLYCEVMRACLLIVNNVLDKSQWSVSLWGAFTFIKMPQILLQLHVSNKGILEKNDFSDDVVNALEMLLQFTALLDVIDAKWPSNCLFYLMTALHKAGLIQESHVQKFKSMRDATMVGGPLKLDPSTINSSALPPSGVLQQAEPLLANILMTLDKDYGEIQEPLLNVLCKVLSGKSFELILAVATVEGKLRTFVSRLIKFNEGSRELGGVSGKNAHTRAMLFDITFLMLCLIVQTYGSDVVLSEQNGKSFFEQWVRDCLVERGRPKSPDQILQHFDPNRVTKLLSQLNSSECDFGSHVKWHEVCLSVPAAIKEVLLAWEHEALSTNDVKRILNALGSKMCCLPVCAATWLCSYMQILHQDALLKPMNMVQQLLSKSSCDGKKEDIFVERSDLMAEIICKMQQDVPIAQPKVKSSNMSHSIISRQPISEQLSVLWAGIQQRGWLHHDAAQALENLLPTAGCNWFVTNIVKEVLKFSYQEELGKAVDLAFAVFHLDIESCTLALLSEVLPKYLQNRLLNDELIEPQGSALARLCAYCIFAAAQLEGPTPTSTARSRKRAHQDDEDGDLGPSSKLLRLSSLVNDNGDSTAAPSLVFNQSLSLKPSSPNGVSAIGDPLAAALRDLFAMMNVLVTRDGEISLQTHFVFRFLEFIVASGKEHAPIVLQDMPTTLKAGPSAFHPRPSRSIIGHSDSYCSLRDPFLSVPNHPRPSQSIYSRPDLYDEEVPSLIRALPEMFSTQLLLGLYGIQTPSGRKDATRDLCLLRNLRLRSQYVK